MAGSFAISILGVGLMLRVSRRAGVLDIPNHRSSHSVPTPRGGGVALVAAVLWGLTTELVSRHVGIQLSDVALIVAIVALAAVGWLDDTRSMRVGVRLAVHIACGVAITLVVAARGPHAGVLEFLWLAWWVFWTVASINIVNFMDGLDGMVSAQGVVYGVFVFSLASRGSTGSQFGIVLAAACFGFLLWNWSPAKMFMGDVGSGPLGMFFVIAGAFALGSAPASLLFLPLLPLFLDAFLTVLLRIRRREQLTQAHRSHLYQRLANGGWGHARVTSLYALAAAFGAVLALCVRNGSGAQLITAIAGYGILVVLGWTLLDRRIREVAATSSEAGAPVAGR
ncbi:MAG: MraY family glycosyltransferase [Gemmatimonadaceae bacterium]